LRPWQERAADDPGFDWSSLEPNEPATGLVPESLARKHVAFPARVTAGRLVMVMAEPGDYTAIRSIEARTRMEVAPVRGEAEDILRAVDVHYSSSMPSDVVDAVDERFASRQDSRYMREVREIPLVRDGDQEEDEDDDGSPVVTAVDSLVAQAVKARATDVHIEPLEHKVRVRFRIDGFLQEVAEFPLAAHAAIMSRIKVMSGMDIAERRRPQDGHFSVRVGSANLDVRAATTDTVQGETVVLRLLNKSMQLFSLGDLGLGEQSEGSIQHMLRAPYGIMLVAGPTGAGKTTTLYAALHQLNSREMNIITIEDPVEYRFEGVNSIQVSERAGLSFPRILRAVLRLDPDVIMVGEIRDAETAHIAVQAALTGHLVLSSVHANDSVRAVTRLLDLGVEPFLLSSALLGVVAQRMVRRIDSHCPVAYAPDEDELKSLRGVSDRFTEDSHLYLGEGCHFCSFTGYHGRTGMFEVLTASDDFKAMVMRSSDYLDLSRQAVSDGMITMREDGAGKILSGATTPFEVLRSIHTV
ncbi:MAG: GspE/PulE family protein, partial [Chloroflexota bacterium]